MQRLAEPGSRTRKSLSTRYKTLLSSRRTRIKSSKVPKKGLILKRETIKWVLIEEVTRVINAAQWSPWTTIKIPMTTQPYQLTMAGLACRETMSQCQMTSVWEVDQARWSRETSLRWEIMPWMSIMLEPNSQTTPCKISTEATDRVNSILDTHQGRTPTWILQTWQWDLTRGCRHSLSKTMPTIPNCKATTTQIQWWTTSIHQILASHSLNRWQTLRIKTILQTIWEISIMFKGEDLTTTKTTSCTRAWTGLMVTARVMIELSD